MNDSPSKELGIAADKLHSYHAKLVFLIDVEVDRDRLDPAAWSSGPDSCPNRLDYCIEHNKDYGASWRSVHFPSTLSPVLYGEEDQDAQLLGTRIHSQRIHQNMLAWYRKTVQRHFGKKGSDGITSFEIVRMELLVYDRRTKESANKSYGQLLVFTEVETSRIGDINNIFTFITRNVPKGDGSRSLVQGGMLYNYLEAELPAVLSSGIHFYDDRTYARDTEAKIYSACHLRIHQSEVDQILEFYRQNERIMPDGVESWLPFLVQSAANIRLDKLLKNGGGRVKKYQKRAYTISYNRYALATRLGAAFLTLDKGEKRRNLDSELYFLSEHIDALALGRLQDQILRHAEYDLAREMRRYDLESYHNFSDALISAHHRFTADTIRYWMDDVIANSGMGINTLSAYKQAIGYQERFDKMRIKIEDVSMLANQDYQKQIAEEQEEAHQRQLDITNRQQDIFLVLTIISAIALPASFLNDGLAFLQIFLGFKSDDPYSERSFWWIFIYIIIAGSYGLYKYLHGKAYKKPRGRKLIHRFRSGGTTK